MRKVFFALLCLLPWATTACVDSHSNRGPASCFEKAYDLALKGKIDDTAQYFTDDILNLLKTNPDWTLQKIWAARLNDGTVKSVKIIERQTDDKNCDIKFMMITNDGQMTDAEDALIFDKGMWKFNSVKRLR